MDTDLTEPEAAAILELSVRTMQRYRKGRRGPAHTIIGGRNIAYKRVDLDAWREKQRKRVEAAE